MFETGDSISNLLSDKSEMDVSTQQDYKILSSILNTEEPETKKEHFAQEMYSGPQEYSSKRKMNSKIGSALNMEIVACVVIYIIMNMKFVDTFLDRYYHSAWARLAIKSLIFLLLLILVKYMIRSGY